MTTHPDWPPILPAPLESAVPELNGKRIEIRPVGQAQTFTRSRLTTWDVLAGGGVWQRIVIKEPRGEEAANPQAEYAALSTLSEHFASHAFLRVPRALLALAVPPALVMEMAPGQRLNVLLRGCRRPARLTQLHKAIAPIPYAGHWLAQLHSLSPPLSARPLPSLPERIELASTRLSANGVSLAQIRATQAVLSPLPDLADQPSVILHGDYTLRNILAHPADGITVLDTALSHTGPAAHDLGWFLAALDFIDRWQMLSRQRLYVQIALDAARVSFAFGYKTAGGNLAADSIAAFTAVRLLERWAEYAEHMRRTQPVLARATLPVVISPYFLQQIAKTSARVQRLLAQIK